jgi:hypothetical protein
MPRARRPVLPSAETSFRGKGAAACVCRPRPFQVGVFLCVLLPVPCGTALLPSLWGKRRRGGSKPWFLPQRCLPLSSRPAPTWRTTYCSASCGCPRVVCSAHAAGGASGHADTHTVDHGSASASRQGYSRVPRCLSERGALAGVETATQHRRAHEPSELPHESREPRVLGFLDSVQTHQYTREQSHGSPPVLGVWSQETRAEASPCGSLCATGGRRVASAVDASRPRRCRGAPRGTEARRSSVTTRAMALPCSTRGQPVHLLPLTSPPWCGSAPARPS